MKITFLGTRGEVEEKERTHRYQTGLLIRGGGTKILIDCGEVRFLKEQPEAIILTHAHSDHTKGLKGGTNIPVYLTKETEEGIRKFPLEKKTRLEPGREVTFGGLKVTPYSVVHSVKAPGVLFKIREGNFIFIFAPDVLSIPDREKVLERVDLYIGDGSSLVKNLVRRSDDKVIGHSSVKTQIAWLHKAGIPRAIFTHWGTEAIRLHGQTLKFRVRRLGGPGVKAEVASDGMTIESKDYERLRRREAELLEAVLPYKPKIEKKIDLVRTRDDWRIFGGWYTTLKLKGRFKYSKDEILNTFLIPCLRALIAEGTTEFHAENWKKWPKEIYLEAFDKVVKKFRYLVDPHAKLIWEGKKTATVHARRFIQGSFFSIVGPKYEYGFARFLEGKPISLEEFSAKAKEHHITEDERKEWWPDKTSLYFYKLRTWIPLEQPRAIKVPKGIQTYGSRADLKEGFAGEIFDLKSYEPDKLKDLSDEELQEKREELIAFFEQRGAKEGDELVINAYQFLKDEMTRRELTIEKTHALDNLTASLAEGKLDNFLLERAKGIQELGQIIWRPNFASVTGSVAFVEDRLPNDLDTVFRTNEVDDGLLLKVDRIFEKYYGSGCHPIPGPYGPNWRHLPIWDLALVPTKELKFVEINEPGFIAEFYEALEIKEAVARAASPELRKQALASTREDKIELNRFFLTLKPTRPAFPEERMTLESLLKYFKPEDFPVNVEKKYDGANHIIFKDGDKVTIISEDGEDNTSRLPKTIEAVKKLKAKSLALLDEIEAWDGDKHLPREVASGYLHSKRKADDSHLMNNIYGVVFVNGVDLHKKTEAERRTALEGLGISQSTVNEPDLKERLNLAPVKEARNLAELKSAIQDLRKRPASEGVVVKKHKAIYYLDRNSRNGWFKLHNTAILAGIVVEPVQTKIKGIYNYRYAIDQQNYKVKPGDLAEVKDREWLEVGKSFSTGIKATRGDIIEIEFETLNFIKAADGTIKVTAWVPRFMRKIADRSKPDAVTEIVARAKENLILREKTVMPDGRTIYASEAAEMVEFLDQEEYLSYAEEQGVVKEQTKRSLEVFEFLERMDDWQPSDADIREAEEEDPGFAKVLRKAQAAARKLPRSWAVIQNHFRGKSQHKDFRVKMNDYLRGWTITDQPEGEITKDVETVKDGRYWQEKIKWKFRPDMDPATHVVAISKAKQPVIWLEWSDKGMGKYAAAKPGSVTATRFEWGVVVVEDEGFAYLTVKKPYFEEYFLNMKYYKGRMVVRLIGVGEEWEKPPKGKLQWQTWFNLKDQTPYILSRRARVKKDYVPDGVNTTASGLPPDWEKKIPIVMRWWVGKLARAEKLARMDQAYNYLIEKGELKGRPLKETPEPKLVDFIIRRHWWRGQTVVRGMPVQHWDLVIDAGKDYLDEFNLELDPLISENLEAGIPAFRKKCKVGTPKGELFRRWMKFEGSIPPNHPEWGNPNKKIPAYMKIVDKGKVNWIEDTDLFSSFEFKGQALKGYVTLCRESPDADIWVMRRAALPGEKRKDVLEAIGVQ